MSPILNMKNTKYYDINTVRIDRRTRWGNPYRVGKDGTREEVIEKYRQHLWRCVKGHKVKLKDLAALHGKTLACWCAPEPCHGEVLERAAAWAHKKLQERKPVLYEPVSTIMHDKNIHVRICG